jgi:hypothetical protein
MDISSALEGIDLARESVTRSSPAALRGRL